MIGVTCILEGLQAQLSAQLFTPHCNNLHFIHIYTILFFLQLKLIELIHIHIMFALCTPHIRLNIFENIYNLKSKYWARRGMSKLKLYLGWRAFFIMVYFCYAPIFVQWQQYYYY